MLADVMSGGIDLSSNEKSSVYECAARYKKESLNIQMKEFFCG